MGIFNNTCRQHCLNIWLWALSLKNAIDAGALALSLARYRWNLLWGLWMLSIGYRCKFSMGNYTLKGAAKLVNNGVFTVVFSCWCVACEDTGRAAYSQLCLHVIDEYDRQQAGISCEISNHRTTCCICTVYTKRVPFVLAHTRAKVRNFGSVANKMQCEHTTAFSCSHKRCW